MIRKFEINDLSTVMKLWLETNIQAHCFIPEQYWTANFDMVEELLPNAEIYVYEQNNNIKGFIGIDSGYIAGIFVDNKEQSQGIGKQLIDKAKELYSELNLMVYQKNDKAIRFYKREGFIITQKHLDEKTDEYESLMIWSK